MAYDLAAPVLQAVLRPIEGRQRNLEIVCMKHKPPIANKIAAILASTVDPIQALHQPTIKFVNVPFGCPRQVRLPACELDQALSR